MSQFESFQLFSPPNSFSLSVSGGFYFFSKARMIWMDFPPCVITCFILQKDSSYVNLKKNVSLWPAICSRRPRWLLFKTGLGWTSLLLACEAEIHTCSVTTWAASAGSWHWFTKLQISWLFTMKLMPSVVRTKKLSLACCSWNDTKGIHDLQIYSWVGVQVSQEGHLEKQHTNERFQKNTTIIWNLYWRRIL